MPSSKTTTTAPKQLELVKHGQRWVFRYTPGGEREVLSQIADAARDQNTNFDWFDAAVLCHQMGVRISAELERQTDPPTEGKASNEQTERHHG